MKRFDDWERRLSDAIDARRFTSLDWGKHDCVTFAAECVKAMTGCALIDPTWSSEDEATDQLDKAGGLIQAVTSVLGDPLRVAQGAMRGDVAVIAWRDGGNRAALGIVVGPSVVAIGELGLTFIPRDMIRVAWAVGR